MGGKPSKDRYHIGDVYLGWRGKTPTADWRNDEGKRKRTNLTAAGIEIDDEETARALLAAWCKARDEQRNIALSHTCQSLWSAWLVERAADGFDNSVYEFNWRALKPHFGHRNPMDMNAQDWRAYAKGRFDAGRASATVHTEMSRLRYCLQWAFDNHHLPRMPITWLPPRGKPRDLVLTVDEARRLRDAAKEGDPHIYVFICLALTTGARHAAILELKWSRVDFGTGLIEFAERKPNENPMSKSWQKGRATVPMGSLARGALALAYAGRRTDYVIEHGGRPLKSIREGFANAVKRAGLDESVTPHTIRHSIVTWCRERGADFHQIAQLVGHGDSKTSELTYTHTDPLTYLRSTVDIIDAEFVEAKLPPPKDGSDD